MLFVKFIPSELILLINKSRFNAIPFTWSLGHIPLFRNAIHLELRKLVHSLGRKVITVPHTICEDKLQMYLNIKSIPEEKLTEYLSGLIIERAILRLHKGTMRSSFTPMDLITKLQMMTPRW